MPKIRLLAFIFGIILVGVVGTFVAYYARGYKFNFNTLKFLPNGILVIKSEPDGASVIINGNLNTATNANISLSPGIYDVEVKKEGFFSWYKRLTIDKEIVTQADISLFRNVPSLTPVTFSGANNPIMSPDGGKIVYSVLPEAEVTDDKLGLWTLDTYSLPLGFTNDPKRITDGDLTGANYSFSPDGRQILLTTSNGIFVLDSGSFTPQIKLINISSQKETTIAGWQKDKNAIDTSLIKNLPQQVNDILVRKTSQFVFSPDQNMVLYTASASGILPEKLITPLPGASTQRQERDIQIGRTYVYDIKEDRNFLISDQQKPVLRWMSSSRHLLLATPGQITILDYDGTNRELVYSGSYVGTFAFPFNNTTRLLILTNLGAEITSPNLYAVTIK